MMLPISSGLAALADGDNGPFEFMMMPSGVRTITPSQGGKPVSLAVLVDARAATNLERQRAAVMAATGKRVYFDFNHEDREASFWPEKIFYKECVPHGPPAGIYARGEFSEAGRTGVQGKMWREFSPIFFVDSSKGTTVDKPATIICNERARPNFGGFVNDGAFTGISPLWAKAARSGTERKEGNERDRDKKYVKTKSGESLQAKGAGLERELEDLKAKQAGLKEEIETLEGGEKTAEAAEAIAAKTRDLDLTTSQIEATELKIENERMQTALVADRTAKAKEAIKAAVARGAIAAKDEALQAKWETWLVEDEDMFDALKAMRGSVALQPARITVNPVKIVREDSQAVLAAFASEQNPLKRAAIYKTEIVKRYNDGDDLPIKANNAFGTLSGTLVTQRTLELLKLKFPVLSGISTDFSDQPGQYGQTIQTRVVSIPGVQTYDPNNGWADSDMVTVDVPVTLNQQKGVPITLNAQTLASTTRRLFDEVAPAQAYALAKDMVDQLYAVILAANFTSQPTVAAQIDWSRSFLIDVGVALDGRGVPDGPMNRTMLLNGAYYGQLKKDNAIVTLSAFQDKGIIEEGVLPDVEGFRVVKAINLPGTANMTGFGFSKSALAMAARLDGDYTNVLPGASYGNVTTVTDPDLGLSVLQVQYVDHKKATATQRISLIYGVAPGQNNAGQLLKSQ
jgi:hypothetical protein